MPNYSTFKYGTHEYGALGGAITRAYLLVQVVDYQRVVVQIEVPSNVGDGYALVRGHTGAAEDPSDGLTVAAGQIVSPLFNVIDGLDESVPVPPGIIYYTLFVFDSQGVWTKEAASSAMVPRQRGTLNKMLSMLPGFYVSEEHNPIDPFVPDSQLAKFLAGFALTYDELTGSVDATLPENRSRSVIRRLHDAYANGVGMPTEYTIGVAASARLRREAGYIYRHKGTLLGITAYVEALTGWGADVFESSNLLRASEVPDDWTVSGLSLSNESPSTVPDLPNEDSDAPFGRDEMFVCELLDTIGTMWNPAYVGVTPGTPYYFGLWAKTDDTLTATLTVDWLDKTGASITADDSTPITATPTWAEYHWLFTPPDGAVYAAVTLRFDGAIGEIMNVDMLSFGEVNEFRPAREVTIVLRPDRVNLLWDPSMDSGDEAFVAVTGTFEYSDEESMYGGYSGKAVGAPDFEFVPIAYPRVPVDGPYRYSLSMYGFGTSTDAAARLVWYDEDDVVLRTDTQEFGDLSGGWTRLDMTVDSPLDSAYVVVSVAGTDTLYVDAATFEQSDRPQVFFSGSTGDFLAQDTMWMDGTPASWSLLYANRLVKVARLKNTIDYYLPFGVAARILLWNSPDPLVASVVPGTFIPGV